jgi:hypothetical protein
LGEKDGMSVTRIAAQLAWLGIQVDIFTSETSPELSTIHAWRENIQFRYVAVAPGAGQKDPSHDFLERMQESVRLCERLPDLIHATSWQSGWVASEFKAEMGIPFILSYEAPAGVFAEGRFDLAQRVIRLADAIVVSSAHEREHLLSRYEADPTYIVEIPQNFAGDIHPDELCVHQPGDTWQSTGHRVAALYEEVLAVRRVTIPALPIPVFAAGRYEDLKDWQVAQQSCEPTLLQARRSPWDAQELPTALPSPLPHFSREAGMLNLPLGLTE